jgi:hypothetical protein
MERPSESTASPVGKKINKKGDDHGRQRQEGQRQGTKTEGQQTGPKGKNETGQAAQKEVSI